MSPKKISSLVLICDAKTWFPPKKKTVLDSGLSLCTDWVFDFVQEMGDIKLAPQEAGVTQKISSLVLNGNAKTRFPQKEDKSVLDNGLSLCTDWVFDFVQVMGEIKLTLQGVGVTQKILLLSLDL